MSQFDVFYDAYHAMRAVRRLRVRVDNLQAIAYQIGAQELTDMPRGGGISDSYGIIDKLMDIKNMYATQISELLDKMADAERLLSTLPPDDQELMRLRYFDGLSWPQVASELSCSLSVVFRLHREIRQRFS